ncbi:MAG: DNA/RNA non-specific endonuclease [Clostridia bacterium]|nr:DNA/RNA non-specific endonuclease [Clostridia bacterium]
MGVESFAKPTEISEVNKPSEIGSDTFDPDKRIDATEKNETPENNSQEYDPDKRIDADETSSPDKVYNDDNGEPYRINDDLVPNNEFTKNDYKYTTDSEGRVTSAEGKLQVKDHPDRKDMPDNMEKVGKGDQKENDQRGHLIGDQFNGSGELENLVPMDANLNQGDYKKMETTLADAVKDGKDVYLKVEPIYNDNSNRPSSFRVSYTIDGEKTVVNFLNGSENK